MTEVLVPGLSWEPDQSSPSLFDPWAAGSSEAPRLTFAESLTAEGGRMLVADPTGEPLVEEAQMSRAWGALRSLQADISRGWEGLGPVWREVLPLFLNPDPGVRAHTLETVMSWKDGDGDPALRLELQLWWEGGVLSENPPIQEGGAWVRPMKLPWVRPMKLPWGHLHRDCPELWTAARPPLALDGRQPLSYLDARFRDRVAWQQAAVVGSGLAWGRVLGVFCLPSDVHYSDVGLPPHHLHLKPRAREGWGPLTRENQTLQGALYDAREGKTSYGPTFLRNLSLRCVLVPSPREAPWWPRDEDLLSRVTIARRGLLAMEMFLSRAVGAARKQGNLREVYQNQHRVWAEALRQEAEQTYAGPPQDCQRFRASTRPWEIYQNAFLNITPEEDRFSADPLFPSLNGGKTVQHHASHSRLMVALGDGLGFNSELPHVRNLPPGANPELFDMVAGFMIGQQLEGHNPRFQERG